MRPHTPAEARAQARHEAMRALGLLISNGGSVVQAWNPPPGAQERDLAGMLDDLRSIEGWLDAAKESLRAGMVDERRAKEREGRA